MASTIDDEDLSISISSTNTRRGSNRPQDGTPDQQRQPAQQQQQRAETTQMPSRTSQRLGQYRIERTLGEGSFGKVKLAVHQVSGQRVALKIISRRKLVTRDMAGRIEREIQYLQLLRHPHIIKLYTVITTPSEIIMVLEYAGGELFDYIVQHGKMPEDRARKFFQQIVCAVEYCHRHKIVHRDLKPENLLLDEHLNVKIADFGLSNIMTDGNFLKTSCGSPNYAAPEVISGKLYAGPEVDVWSCGVILFVLLCGKLPFDDEYIPVLFKKISQGNYKIPSYISPGAASLIKKMLVVNPVSRITIYEIRQDPWFNKDLAPYLQLPPEEFFNTGVDPNKAIDPNTLGPAKSPAVANKLHDTVVGKLGKTMGYAKGDVQEALAKDEPSAIKDAYLIVRENQIMKQNPLLSQESGLQGFIAQSPPNYDHSHMASSPLSAMVAGQRAPPTVRAPSEPIERPRPTSVSSHQNSIDVRSPINTIAVLPSSLPDYHVALMKGRKPNITGFEATPYNDSGSPKEQTREQQEATARRLKPHSRSQINLQHAAKPEGMTPLPSKNKPKPTKWQFGIRSRNQPAEAMLAIYKALRAMGADWEVQRARRPGGGGSDDSGENSRSRSRSRSSSTSSYRRQRRDQFSGSDDEDEEESRGGLTIRNGDEHLDPNHARGRPRKTYGPHNDFGYSIPEDPWVINARFRKEGMFPPGINHPSSTHSSRVDLQEGLRRRSSTKSSAVSLVEREAYAGPNSGSNSAAQSMHGEFTDQDGKTYSNYPDADETCYIYVTIQLYNIGENFYLVDFKCAGYERLVRKVHREITKQMSAEHDGSEWRALKDDEEVPEDEKGLLREREELVGAGRATDEKRAASPFPFLDIASRLIIQLAEGD